MNSSSGIPEFSSIFCRLAACSPVGGGGGCLKVPGGGAIFIPITIPGGGGGVATKGRGGGAATYKL